MNNYISSYSIFTGCFYFNIFKDFKDFIKN